MKISITFTAKEKAAIRSFFTALTNHVVRVPAALGENTMDPSYKNLLKIVSVMDKVLEKEIIEISLPESVLSYSLTIGKKILVPIVNFANVIVPLAKMFKGQIVPLIINDANYTSVVKAITEAYDQSEKNDPSLLNESVIILHYTTLMVFGEGAVKVGVVKEELEFAKSFYVQSFAVIHKCLPIEAKDILAETVDAYKNHFDKHM